MSIEFSCQCGRQFRAPDHSAGKSATCPGCGVALIVPQSAGISSIVGWNDPEPETPRSSAAANFAPAPADEPQEAAPQADETYDAEVGAYDQASESTEYAYEPSPPASAGPPPLPATPYAYTATNYGYSGPAYQPTPGYGAPPPPAFAPFTTPTRAAPRKNRPGLFWIMVVGIPIVMCVVIGVSIKSYRDANLPNAARTSETLAQKNKEVSSAFGQTQTIAMTPAEQASVNGLFARMIGSIKQKNAPALANCFDPERMVDELAATGIPGITEFTSGEARRGFLEGFRQSMNKMESQFGWTSFELRQARSLPGAPEAIAFVRMRDDEGNSQKMRFWIRKTNGQWRIYDFELLEISMRMTTMMGSMFAGGAARNPAMLSATQQNIAAVQAAGADLTAGNPGAAITKLQAARNPIVPGAIEAIRLLLLASAQVQKGDYADGLKTADQSEQLQPEQPGLQLIRSRAYNGVEEYAKAVAAADLYEKALGADSVSSWNRGTALAALNRNDEAAVSFRAGLADDPTSGDDFEGLLRIVGEKGLPELTILMTKLPDQATALRAIANNSIGRDRPDEVATVAKLYRHIDPSIKDAASVYIAAEVEMLRRNYPAALKLFDANQELLASDPWTRNVAVRQRGVAARNGVAAAATTKPAR